jgi:hypothetical protein
MVYHRKHTAIAIRNISHVVYYIKDDTARWYKVNWIIIGASHAICKTHGARGHKTRPIIRRRLWNLAQREYPILNRYSIPKEITGDCLCKIKWYYRILDFFLKFSELKVNN